MLKKEIKVILAGDQRKRGWGSEKYTKTRPAGEGDDLEGV
jgi:hypothetical protein